MLIFLEYKKLEKKEDGEVYLFRARVRKCLKRVYSLYNIQRRVNYCYKNTLTVGVTAKARGNAL